MPWFRHIANAKRWLAMLVAVTACGEIAAAVADPDIFAINRLLGAGLNVEIAALPQTRDSCAGADMATQFKRIRAAGFRSVRIPLGWERHAAQSAPYDIQEVFFSHVDQVIDRALAAGLAIVIDVHDYVQMHKEPQRHLPRLAAIWRQIAERYRDYPPALVFELLNEPHGALTDHALNAVIRMLLTEIRSSNPRRGVITGGTRWSDPDGLEGLQLPEADRYLIASFHYYRPFSFTHQGAQWVTNSAAWAGTTWRADAPQLSKLEQDFARAAAWAKVHNRPLYLGEFGAYGTGDMASRVQWTYAVARGAESHGMSWAYWEFSRGFGLFDCSLAAWRVPLVEALLPGFSQPLR